MPPPENAVPAQARASRAPLVGECIMGGFAIFAAGLADSVALEAHAARVALDALVCLVSLFAARAPGRLAGGGDPAEKGEALAVLGVVLSLAAWLVELAGRGAEAWLNPHPLHGAGMGLVALGAAGLAQLVFWARFHRLHAEEGSAAAREQSRVWGNAVSLTLFAFVAVVAGMVDRGERPWLWRLDAAAGLLLLLPLARSLGRLGRRALRVLLRPTPAPFASGARLD